MVLKRLVTSAATITILGCSDGAEQGATVPQFVGNPSNPGAVTPPVDTAVVPNPAPAATNPDPAAGAVPAAGQAASEDQNPDNIGIDNAEGAGSEAGGGETSAGMETGAEQTADMNQPSPEMPAPAEEPEPEPVEEEPEPIVRPALDCGAPPPALQGGIQSCQSETLGSVSGQDWFLWFNGGSGCMTTYDNLSGAFSAQWNNPPDFLARLGFWFDETQRFEDLGEIGADIKFTRQGGGGGFSFIGIYGWTVNPLVEYYIVEDSFGNGPAQPYNTQLRGNFNVDGAQYNIYVGNRPNTISILGTPADFIQILSVRQNPRQCGHVSISQHFRQWQSMGMNLGFAKEAKVMVEGGQNSGSITFTHANITITPPE